MLAWTGTATSNTTLVGEMVCVGPKLWPPSVDFAATIALFWTSCQATYPESLGNDALETDLYILRDQLRIGPDAADEAASHTGEGIALSD